MKKIIKIANIDETKEFAKNLAKKLTPGSILCLKGDLGVGKTVIAKEIGKFFNIKETQNSPTFNLVKTYNVKNNKIKRIHHFDLYRLKNIDELINIGFDDYIYDIESIVIIEWPELAYKYLDDNIIKVTIKNENNDVSRVIEIEE